MLQMLIGPAMDLAKDFVKGKAEEKKAIQQRKITAIQNDSDWESKMADSTKNSIKDEWFAFILSAPLIAVAYSVAMDDPQIIERMNEAFAALNQLPDWYQYLLFIAVTASFGVKGADKIMSLKKGKQWTNYHNGHSAG